MPSAPPRALSAIHAAICGNAVLRTSHCISPASPQPTRADEEADISAAGRVLREDVAVGKGDEEAEADVVLSHVLREGAAVGTGEVEANVVAAGRVLREGVIDGFDEAEAVEGVAVGCVLLEDVAGVRDSVAASEEEASIPVAAGRVPREGVVVGTVEVEANQEVCDLAVLDGDLSSPIEEDAIARAVASDNVTCAVEGDAIDGDNDVVGKVGGQGSIRRDGERRAMNR